MLQRLIDCNAFPQLIASQWEKDNVGKYNSWIFPAGKKTWLEHLQTGGLVRWEHIRTTWLNTGCPISMLEYLGLSEDALLFCKWKIH